MFKNILSYFTIRSKTSEILRKPAGHTLASLNIEVNNDGSLNIVCDWPEFNDNNVHKIKEVAYFYAVAIHALNKGFLEKDIIDTLINHNKGNVFNSLFAQNTLLELLNLEKNLKQNSLNKSNQPIVSPLEVFKSK
jgi:hypothetical protein